MQSKMETDRQELPHTKERKIKPFQELNLMDDYMFDLATLDIETCKDIVELSLHIRIREIRWKEGQKVIHNLPGKRGIRLDFYVEDIDGVIFNVEMQIKNVGNLPKRTRFYRALIDSPLLKSGEKEFDHLPPTYIIFICGFDAFGYGKYRYTFQSMCREEPGLTLGDECTTVFLNTRGTNKEEVEPELIDFLHFVEKSTKDVAESSEDERIHNMYKRIESLKKTVEMEMDYMTAEEWRRILEEEAIQRGMEAGMEAGMKAGMEAGMEAGMKTKLRSIVLFMKEKGYQSTEIVDILGEDADVIKKILQESAANPDEIR